MSEGNGDIAGYAWTGQLGWSGTSEDTHALTYTYNASPGTTYCPSDGEANCFIVSDGALGGSGVRASTVQVDTFGFIQQVEDSYGSIWTMTYDGSQDLHTITGPNGVATNTYQYNTTLASPMEHSMSHVIDPDYNNTTIAYNSTGMANVLVSPTGGTTNYSYANTTCATSTGCVGPGMGQATVVNYPDGENDYDDYGAGVLASDSFGPGSSSGSSTNQAWLFNYSYPSHPDRLDDRDSYVAEPWNGNNRHRSRRKRCLLHRSQREHDQLDVQ